MQPNLDNLIVGLVFFGLTLIFMRSVMNSVSPGLSKMIVKMLKAVVVYLVEFVAWVVKVILCLFNIDLDKKELPGRKR
jgi:hypothetical protein